MAKVCSKCGLEQPETNFSKACNTPDGFRYDCKDCVKQYRIEHKEQIRDHMNQYRVEHQEQIIESRKQYYAEHKESTLQQYKVWRDNNKDRAQKTETAWKKNNPDVTKAQWQSRRSKKAGLAQTLTPAQWNHILEKFNNACAYCGAGDKTLHQEHFIPLSSEGEYTHNNIIPACQSCNSSKGKKDFFTWYPTSKRYNTHREKKIMMFLHYTGATQQLTLCT